ncbi:MAG: hypothetical protein AAF633_17555, partial [Chloroflexota bacterium]
AVEFATGAAPTVVALRTQASNFATSAAPTVEAGLDTLATAAVDTQERAIQARATLDAAGIDAGYLFRKVSSIFPDENGQIVVSFREEEVNIVLNSRLLVMKTEGTEPPIRNMTVEFQPGTVIVRGAIVDPIEGNIEVGMVPIVENGTLRYMVSYTNLNGNPVPQLVVGRVEALINNTFASAVNGLASTVELQAVLVESGTVTFVAQPRSQQ